MSKLLFNPITAVIISLLTIIFWFSLYQTTQEMRDSNQDTQKLRENNNQLTQDILQLEEKVDLAQSREAKEAIARNELLMQKEGEIVLKLPDVEISKEETKIEQELTPWQEWQGLLF